MCVQSKDVEWHQHGDSYTFFKKVHFDHLQTLETNYLTHFF
jgi:hypothetical protein